MVNILYARNWFSSLYRMFIIHQASCYFATAKIDVKNVSESSLAWKKLDVRADSDVYDQVFSGR